MPPSQDEREKIQPETLSVFELPKRFSDAAKLSKNLQELEPKNCLFATADGNVDPKIWYRNNTGTGHCLFALNFSRKIFSPVLARTDNPELQTAMKAVISHFVESLGWEFRPRHSFVKELIH